MNPGKPPKITKNGQKMAILAIICACPASRGHLSCFKSIKMVPNGKLVYLLSRIKLDT